MPKLRFYLLKRWKQSIWLIYQMLWGGVRKLIWRDTITEFRFRLGTEKEGFWQLGESIKTGNIKMKN